MLKKLLLTACLSAFALQSQAEATTKPEDIIGISNTVFINGSEERTSNYTKKWKDLRLNKDTLHKLNQKNAWVNQTFDDNFQIGFLSLINDAVQRVVFHSKRGNIVMMMLPEGTYCYMNLDGNGSVFFVQGNQCYSENGPIDKTKF